MAGKHRGSSPSAGKEPLLRVVSRDAWSSWKATPRICLNSFDALINAKLRCVRAGGHFLYADVRGQTQVPEWVAALVDAALRMLSQRVINAEVGAE